MKHFLLKSAALFVLVFLATIAAKAQDVVYGLMPSPTYFARSTSFNLDDVNTESATKLTADKTFDNVIEVKGGVCAGDKYYAFVSIEDPTDYDQTMAFVTLNFTTGTLVEVNNYSYTYGNPGYYANGMAFDSNSGKLYAIEAVSLDEGGYETKLHVVDPETGNLTEYTSWQGKFVAIVSDNNGGFYLVQTVTAGTKNYPELYHADSMLGIEKVVSNEEVSAGWASSYSLVVSEDGKTVCLIANKNVITFDTEAKTVALKGTLSANLAGATKGKSSADGTATEKPEEEVKNTRFLVSKTTYGDYMGYFSKDVDAKIERYYYNNDGVRIFTANSGRTYNEDMSPGDFEPASIVKATLDDEGRVVKNCTYQWGVYDYEDMAWRKTSNDVSFAYDEEGRLLADTTSYSFTVYSYNADGTVATRNEYQKSTGTLIQSIAYSNFDANGNPSHYDSSSPAYSSYNYQGEISYDANGNKVEEYQFTMKTVPDYGPIPEIKQVEKWTYEGKNLRLYEKMMADGYGSVAPYQKLTYTPVDGNEDDVMVTDSTYFDGIWMQNGCAQRYRYTDFAGMDELVRMNIAANVAPDEINSVDLDFSIPQLAYSMPCKMVVYRDGQPIDTCDVMDIMDFETQYCRYKDKGLKNGTYDYFVQPLFGAGSDMDEETVVWSGYYITDVASVTVWTELPAVTDLKLAGGNKVTTGTVFNPVTDYKASVSWTNPENAADYGFISNSLYFDEYHMAEASTTDVEITQMSSSVYNDVTKAYIVTRYKYGKAFSDTIEIKLTDVDALATAVDVVTAGDDVKATFSGNTITLSEKANVAIYSDNGNMVCREKDVDFISLSSLPAAIYIICIEKDGKTSAYKYIVN